MTETYEILALKYARHSKRTRQDNFIQPDDHASPQPLDYFVWVIRNANRTILVDTGFDRTESKNRGRDIDREPVEVLSEIGIEASRIDTVVVTHLHYDHAGTLDRFPGARFHVQEAEVAYATGACMCEEILQRPYTADHICSFVKKIYSGRVTFHDGDGEIAPGVTVHKVPGHTMGVQCVRVSTESGAVVLASDATHYYENFERRMPFLITVDVAQTLRSYARLERLAASRKHIVPGHDPLVLERYPAWKPQTSGMVHRLDVPRLK
jgi:glyoxylase-like metal-dependent hydrolase (beta-lactamase superfamily II)